MSTTAKPANLELQHLPSPAEMRRTTRSLAPAQREDESLGFEDGHHAPQRSAAPHAGNQMHSSAFFSDSRQSVATTTLAFSIIFHSTSDKVKLVTSSIATTLTPSEATVFKTLNFSHSSPISLKIVGSHVPSWAKFSSLLVTDNCKSPKPLHPSVVWRSSSSDRAIPSGFPLFWASSQPVITRETAPESVENLSFWGAELSDIQNGVRTIDAPNQQDSTVIFPEVSVAAAACNYALSEKNPIIKPPLLQNEHYRYAKDRSYIELPRSQFKLVTTAFERKFAEVRASVFDLSVLNFELSDLPGAPDARKARVAEEKEKARVAEEKEKEKEPLMLSLELTTLTGINVKAQAKSAALPTVEGPTFRTGTWSASDL